MNFPKELSELLYKKVGFSEKELSDYFTLDENDKEWILKVKQWLEPKSYGAMRELCREKGGGYNPKPPTFHIPKSERREAEAPDPSLIEAKSTLTTQEPPPAKLVTVKPSQLIYDRFSPRKVKRKRVDRMKEAIQSEGVESVPKPKVTWNFGLKGVEPPPKEDGYWLFDGQATAQALEELGYPQFQVSFYDVSEEQADFLAMRCNQVHGDPLEPVEEAMHLKKMMEKYGFNQKQLGEKFKRSDAWISNRLALLKLGDEEFTRVKPGHARAIVTAPEEVRPELVEKVEREEIPVRPTMELVEKVKEGKKAVLEIPYNKKPHTCFVCGLGTHFPTVKDGKPICLDCVEDPDLEEKFKAKLKEKPSPPPKAKEKKFEPTVPKPTWAERKAMMHPKISKMEEAIAIALTEKGIPFEQQVEFCLESTKVDFHLPQNNLVVELDGEKAHEKSELKDERKRSKLARRHRKRILVLSYGDNTQKSRDEILQKVLDEVNAK